MGILQLSSYLWPSLGALAALLIVAFGRSHLSLLRSLTILTLALILSSPELVTDRAVGSYNILLDISASFDSDQANTALSRFKSLNYPHEDIKLYPFADKLGAEQEFLLSHSLISTKAGTVNGGSTNLASALQELPAVNGSQIFLISDGFVSGENIEPAINVAKTKGYKVYPIFDEEQELIQEGVKITQITAPLVISAQTKTQIRTTIRNSTDRPQQGLFKVFHGDRELTSKVISIPANSEKVFEQESDPNQEGLKAISSHFYPENKTLKDSSATTFLSTTTRQKILIISGDESDSKLLNQALKPQGYGIENLSADNRQLPPLSDFGTVILANASAVQLGYTNLNALSNYVKNGGGLIMTGGNKSFGLGGYIDSPIEEVLPVKLTPPQAALKRLNIAIQLVLDKSKSMADEDRILYAREAAKAVVSGLKDEDYLGVIGFDSNPFIVQRLDLLANIRNSVADRIDRLFPARRTNLLPAIDEARRRLEQVRAGRKHILVLTDGRIPDGGPLYLEIVKAMRILGITVSTVMLGEEVDDALLRQMAEYGGGAFYQTADPRSLPRIFMQDVKVSGGEKTLKEQSEYLVRRGPGSLESTQVRSFPSLKGYVQTKPRDGANLELVVSGNEGAEPLLASGNYGKGKSLAFTSDVSGRWSENWVDWGSFSTLWGELIDSVQHKTKSPEGLVFDLSHTLEHDKIALEATIYSPEIPGLVSAEVVLPSNEQTSEQISFTEIAPGRYKAYIPQSKAGKYQLKLKAGDVQSPPVAFQISPESLGETKGKGINKGALRSLANATGGIANPSREQIPNTEIKSPIRKDLRPYLFGIALLSFILEIILRERRGVIKIINRGSRAAVGARG